MTTRVKIIGLGGIGGYLADPLSRYMSHKHKDVQVTLVDGDVYEEKNRERQQYAQTLGYKAQVAAEELAPKLPNVQFRAKKEYITDDNVTELVRENDIVFLCVDNHATRKLVSDRCQELENVTLISGGNHYTDGNVILYARKNGQDFQKPPTALFESIQNPKDENPGVVQQRSSQGCEAQRESAPQLIVTNFDMAAAMLSVYYSYEQGKANFEQVFVDSVSLSRRPDPEPEFTIED